MSDKDLVAEIRQRRQDSPFHAEGYRKLWARLRFAGIRTSRRRVLRLMREHGLLADQRAGRPHGSRAHDGRITTERVDVMRGSDLDGGFLGIGDSYHPLPWKTLKYDTSMGGYVVDLDKDRLQGAPSYAASDDPDWRDPTYSRRINDFCGPSPGA